MMDKELLRTLTPREFLMTQCAKAARGHCEVGADGSVHASGEWFRDYTRLVAEECAKLCDELRAARPMTGAGGLIAEECAVAIREKFTP